MKELYEKLRRLLAIGGAALLLFIFYLIFMSTDDFLQTNDLNDKKVEAQNLALFGYQEGALAWQLKADYTSSPYSIDHSVIENVFDGILYKNEDPIIDNLQAKKIRVNAEQERLYAHGGIWAHLIKQQNTPQNYYVAQCEELQYFSDEKRTYLHKKIIISNETLNISANQAIVEHTDNTLNFSEGFMLEEKRTQITGTNLKIDMEQDFLTISQNIVLEIKGSAAQEKLQQQDTRITCEQLELAAKKENELIATLNTNIVIWQKDKQGSAEQVLYNEKKEELTLLKNALLVFDRSDWLLNEKTIGELKNKESKKILAEKIVMNGAKIKINTKTKDLTAQGDVRVTLKNQEAHADQANYRENEAMIYMLGHVKLKKEDGSWLNAQQVVIDVKKETFTADGQAESVIYLKR